MSVHFNCMFLQLLIFEDIIIILSLDLTMKKSSEFVQGDA